MIFECPDCRRMYGDPLYHGPDGHAPPALCFDCWVDHWQRVEAIIDMERGHWGRVDVAMFLICQGFSREEAAGRLGVTARTVHNWIRRLRKYPHEIPQWLSDRAAAGSRRTYTEAAK